jgi:hypothetical protein
MTGPEISDRLRRAAERFPPPQVSAQDVVARARRRSVIRRVGSAIIAIAIAIGGTGIVFGGLGGLDQEPADPPIDRCAPIPADITAWWPGDGSGEDLIGGLRAELVGDATFASGKVGQAFAFDGDGDFAAVEHHPALNVGVEDFTLDFWVRFDSIGDEQVLVEKYVQTPLRRTTRGWTLTTFESGVILFALTKAAGASTSPLEIEAGRWMHVAARRRGNTASLLIDGEVVTTEPLRDPTWSLDSPSSLKFGRRGSATDTPGSTDDRGFFLHGRLDEIRLVVGRAMRDREIRRAYLAGEAGTCRPGPS